MGARGGGGARRREANGRASWRREEVGRAGHDGAGQRGAAAQGTNRGGGVSRRCPAGEPPVLPSGGGSEPGRRLWAGPGGCPGRSSPRLPAWLGAGRRPSSPGPSLPHRGREGTEAGLSRWRGAPAPLGTGRSPPASLAVAPLQQPTHGIEMTLKAGNKGSSPDPARARSGRGSPASSASLRP
ncbi:uncharacterized protein WM294_009669 [Sarcoramphus papa]